MIILLLFIPAAITVGQSSLEQAFQEEDAAAFNDLFDAKVDLFVMNKENLYGKAEAVRLMESWFKVHEVKSYKAMHSGESRGQSSNYKIGELQTDQGKYRVYIYYNDVGGKQLINELRIESN